MEVSSPALPEYQFATSSRLPKCNLNSRLHRSFPRLRKKDVAASGFATVVIVDSPALASLVEMIFDHSAFIRLYRERAANQDDQYKTDMDRHQMLLFV